MGKTLHIRNVPLFGYLLVLLVADGDVRGQDFIDPVDGGATIDVAGHLGDDLGGDGRGCADGLGGVDFGIAHLEAMGQHAVQIDQHAVEHGEEGGIIQIVEVQLTAFVGLHHIPWQHVLLGIVFGDDTGQQIALGRDHLAILVGVLVEQIHIALLDQATDLLAQASLLFPGHVTVVTIFDVGARHLLVLASHQPIFNHVLDFVDGYFIPAGDLQGDLLCHAGTIGQVLYACGVGCLGDSLDDPHAIERNSTSISLNHDRFHDSAPDPKDVGHTHTDCRGLH